MRKCSPFLTHSPLYAFSLQKSTRSATHDERASDKASNKMKGGEKRYEFDR